MNCHRARELASEALDGALPTPLSTTFREHLEVCPTCRTFHAELRESLSFLLELPEVEVDDRFNEAVFAKLGARLQAKEPWWLTLKEKLLPEGFGGGAWRWAPLAAAAVLLLVFALSSPRTFPTGSQGLARNDTPVKADFVSNPLPGPLGASGIEAGASEDDQLASGIPQPIEAYLKSSARDLRFDPGERLRRSDYSYPLRRVENTGIIRVGTGNVARGQAQVRPVSDPGVIAF